MEAIPSLAPIPARAAQYLRMSTDHQKYSTQNQIDTIADYAARRGLAVVRDYIDEARSGLRFENRSGLRALIDDVRARRANFDAILVFDISRWGRFQDVDESAYYEFICKEAGIQVHYCAEPFENDGSFASNVMKNLTRASAGKFSRDLSSKVFMGQCRIVRMGFWCGGRPAYGVRRLLVDEHGKPRTLLDHYQRKFLQTDRVLLRPGPASEVETVQRIFRSFVAEKKTATMIADELNGGGLLTSRGKQWTSDKIGKLLQNETYCGNIVFNRSSYKLKQKLVLNPPEMWIRHEGAFEAIVSPKTFAKAQAIIAKRRQQLSDQAALDQLADLRRKKGHLSVAVIKRTKGILDPATYRRRFGSLGAAYDKIGFRPNPRYCVREIRAAIQRTIATVRHQLGVEVAKLGTGMQFDEKYRLVTVPGTTVSFAVARATPDGPPAGKIRWQLRWSRKPDPNAKSDFTVVIQMDVSNTKISHYYLLATQALELAATTQQRVRVTNRVFGSENRHRDLAALASVICPFAGPGNDATDQNRRRHET